MVVVVAAATAAAGVDFVPSHLDLFHALSLLVPHCHLRFDCGVERRVVVDGDALMRLQAIDRQLFFSGVLKSPQLSTPKELEDPLTGPSAFPTT